MLKRKQVFKTAKSAHSSISVFGVDKIFLSVAIYRTVLSVKQWKNFQMGVALMSLQRKA